jgi:formylmethanofuran dehydrogenase subunit E
MQVDHVAELRKISGLHGHVCFGLAVGYRAAVLAKREFGIGATGNDQEIVTVMQESNCCEDAIQAVTSCSWHMGSIIYQECGRYVFIFYNHSQGKSLRLSLKQNLHCSAEEVHRLKEKAVLATDEEKAEFRELNRRLVNMILATKDEDLFDIERFSMSILLKIDRYESLYVNYKVGAHKI